MPADLPAASGRRRPGVRAASFALHTSVLAALLAASSAPTPLYPLYQQRWNLSALTITVVFAAYALALLLALTTAGRLSDHLGRRPVLVGALALQAVAMTLLAAADGPGLLIAARALQGAATGAATTAAGAALLDLGHPDRASRSARANAIAPIAGMAAGVLGSTLLVRFTAHPASTAFVALAALSALQAAAVAFTEETAARRPGALRSLRPRLTPPPAARRALALSGTGVAAVWALGGYYSSLGPALTTLVDPRAPRTAGGLLFLTLTTAAALAMAATRGRPPAATAVAGCVLVLPSAALALAALHGAGLPALFGAAALAGTAFGAVTQAAMTMTLAPLHQRDRAAALASFHVLSYLSMGLPAMAAGALTQLHGPRLTAHGYVTGAAVLALVAAVSLAAGRDRDPGPRSARPARTTENDHLYAHPHADPHDHQHPTKDTAHHAHLAR
ncbi:MFS transporter [Kitasatospora sp. NBC_00374]|uniref:MFS transporter n=1 Tax=Kitasatospora sp. NBC_00374 TaxID=2975964 RepID=UPI00324F7B26